MSSNTMNHIVFLEQAYYFMKNIPGSPAYWRSFLFDVLAMTKQIYIILSKLKGREMSNAEIVNMTYNEKCKMLNSNPAIVAKLFQH